MGMTSWTIWYQSFNGPGYIIVEGSTQDEAKRNARQALHDDGITATLGDVVKHGGRQDTTLIAVHTNWVDQSDYLKTVIVMRCWGNEVKVMAMGHATETAEGWTYTLTIYTTAGFVETYTSTVDTWRQVQDGVEDRVAGEWG